MADRSRTEPALAPSGLLDRTLRRFRRAWRGVGLGPAGTKDVVGPDVSAADRDHLLAQFRACLEARRGEVEARARAAALGATYLGLSETGKRRFVNILAEEFDADEAVIDAAIDAYREQSTGAVDANDAQADTGDRHRALQRLREALVAPRVRLLTRFNELSLGVKFLVDMRADILRMPERRPQLIGLERDLKALLSSWFDIGFLELTRITWNSPAALLEKLIEYEAVHAIQSWDDLKDRLEDDRRCYAFVHPCMPDVPLIFVEIALVDGLTDNIHELLDPTRSPRPADTTDTAIFYSISNCQSGLAGVSFGNFLIKRVVSDLSKDLPNLKTFSTLSPIPGFRRWLERHLEEAGDDLALSDPLRAALTGHGDRVNPATALREVVASPERLIEMENTALAQALAPIVKRLCAHYLLTARHGHRAQDRVAHFHLSNGARIERLNWMGDYTPQGLAASLGMMVNYRYVLNDVDKHHEEYVSTGNIRATSQVQRMLKD